jgi:hypothetical protein
MTSGEYALFGGKEAQPMSKSPTITDAEQLPNPTPGEFLRPVGLSQSALAVAVRVPPRRINEIVLGKRRSRRTLIYGSPVISASRRAFFSGCRPITT